MDFFTVISLLLAAVVAGYQLYVLWFSLVNLYHHYDGALATMRVTQDVCRLLGTCGLLVCWGAVSFGRHMTEKDLRETDITKKPFLQRFLTHGPFGMSFMPGGFAPRLLLSLITLLMLVGGTFVSTTIVAGTQFLITDTDNSLFVKWVPEMGCRADDTLPTTYFAMWFSRFYVAPPDGCYGEAETFFHPPKKGAEGVAHPMVSNATDSGIVRQPNPDRVCMYQCATWKKLSFQDTLKIGGVLTAGAAFLERLTLTLTSSSGWGRLKWSHPLITADSSEEELEQALRYTLHEPRIPAMLGHILSLVIFVCLLIASMRFTAARLDLDGFYTVDFYVTNYFTLAVFIGFINRNIHVWRMAPIIFTEGLWMKGSDTFRGTDSGNKVDIDLYEWYHIRPWDRARYPLSYARAIGPKDVAKYKPWSPHEKLEECQGTDFLALTLPSELSHWEELKVKLIDVEKQITTMEKQKKGECMVAKEDESGVVHPRVMCMQTFAQFTDIWIPKERFGRHGTFKRRRVVVKRGAEGEILGKSHTNDVVVLWDNKDTDLVDIQSGSIEPSETDQLEEDMCQKIPLEAHPSILEQVSPEFSKLEKWLAENDPANSNPKAAEETWFVHNEKHQSPNWHPLDVMNIKPDGHALHDLTIK
jgi:hypothetical protein